MKKAFLVNNGEEYDDYAVVGIFTDEAIARQLAGEIKGEVEEWDMDVPHEQWCRGAATFRARKQCGEWKIEGFSHTIAARAAIANVDSQLGYGSGWGTPDPKTGEYTHGYASAEASTADDAEAMCRNALQELIKKI